jgi:steroid delta-isomerase-like uncharacterized protein
MRINRALSLIVAVCSIWMLAATPAEQKKPQPQVAPATQKAPANLPLPAVSPGQNKANAQRVFTELFNQGEYESISQIYAPNCIVHEGSKTSSLQDAVTEGKGWKSASPDARMSIQNIQEQGDFVTIDWMSQGTHTGRGNGLEPSGKRFMLRGNSRFRFANGKIAEVWNTWDRNDLYRQLGVSPKVGELYFMSRRLLASLDRFFTNSD